MKNARCFSGWSVVAVLATCCSSTLYAAEPKDDVAADPDYRLQGEYVGEVNTANGKKKLGIQVLALGNGKFRAVWREGGLPGEGWDRSEAPGRDGETVAGVTKFSFGDYAASIQNGGTLLLTTGGDVGELNRIVRRSPTLGAKPPAGAIVLFDGQNAEQFENGRMAETGLLKQGATSKRKFQSGSLHIEFRIPFGPHESSRGNSGCYLQSRYEVQILNSFGLKPDNHECGGIPSIKAPDVNMCYPPLVWQTYDVDFTAAQFQDGKKTDNARMTVRHNGIVIHRDVEMPHVTTSAPLAETPEPGPLNLQDHGSEVRYRNIWFVEK